LRLGPPSPDPSGQPPACDFTGNNPASADLEITLTTNGTICRFITTKITSVTEDSGQTLHFATAYGPRNIPSSTIASVKYHGTTITPQQLAAALQTFGGQTLPPPPNPPPSQAPLGPPDQWGCPASDPAIAVFRFPNTPQVTESDLASTPNLDLAQAATIVCRSKLPAGSYVNPNLPSQRFMKAAPNPLSLLQTTQSAGSTSRGMIGVNAGWAFNSSPADLSNYGLVFPNPRYDQPYPDGLRHDFVGNTGRLQGFATLNDLKTHRAGDVNKVCDRVIFVLKNFAFAELVPTANKSDILAYQCANDLLASAFAQGATTQFYKERHF
jgi:hypothetical protein